MLNSPPGPSSIFQHDDIVASIAAALPSNNDATAFLRVNCLTHRAVTPTIWQVIPSAWPLLQLFSLLHPVGRLWVTLEGPLPDWKVITWASAKYCSRQALQHILSFFYMGLVKQGVHCESDEFQHLPVLESSSGCQELLVACLICLSMIIFDFKAYDVCGACNIGFDNSSLTRQGQEQYTYIQGLAYTMLQWLDHHYIIQVNTMPANPASTQHQSYDDILAAVGHFLGDVACYQRCTKISCIDSVPGCNPLHLEEYIHQIFTVHGIPNAVYQGFCVQMKEIAQTGDRTHSITYGSIFTSVWHAERRTNVAPYTLKGNLPCSTSGKCTWQPETL
ncbi:hypothetical protein BJ165DRAFT_1534891 [Panaeolus papilionaceus]|nr:hypothetical protein BJ165DRAFT_1534891 [Panaeolus papilionaceus]